MLREIIQTFEQNEQPTSLREMAARLDVQDSALEGMLDMLVRKGTLIEVGSEINTCRSCGGAKGCPYIVDQPKSYMLARKHNT